MEEEWDVEIPRHRDILTVARTWGVSPSQFMGAEQTARLVFPDGRTAQLVTASPWTEQDRWAAMQLADYEAALCPGCRQPLAETSNNEHEYQYKVGTAIRCHRCTAAAVASEQHDQPHPEAVLFPIELRRPDAGDHGDGEEHGSHPPVEADADAG
jgi:hypothetical protein